MTNDKFDELFGGPPRKPERALTQREMDSGGLGPGRAPRRSCSGWRARVEARRPAQEPLPGRRRGAELRGQRQAPARRTVRRASGSSRRPAMPAARWARPYAAWHQLSRPAAPAQPATTRMQGAISAPRSPDDEIEQRLTAAGGSRSRCATSDDPSSDVAGCWPTEKVVGWFRAAWSSGRARSARRSILGDARSPAMQTIAEPEGQVPRIASGPSRRRCCARTSASSSTSRRDSPYMLLVAPVNEDRRRAMSAAEEALFGIDKLNVPRSDIPGGHARRLLGAHPDRARGDQPALPRPARGVQGARRAARCW